MNFATANEWEVEAAKKVRSGAQKESLEILYHYINNEPTISLDKLVQLLQTIEGKYKGRIRLVGDSKSTMHWRLAEMLAQNILTWEDHQLVKQWMDNRMARNKQWHDQEFRTLKQEGDEIHLLEQNRKAQAMETTDESQAEKLSFSSSMTSLQPVDETSDNTSIDEGNQNDKMSNPTDESSKNKHYSHTSKGLKTRASRNKTRTK